MSSLLSAELSATCNALGTLNKKTGKYLIDDFTLNTVKDLIRYLRRDGEDHEIRRHFGQTKVLQTDLLPMLVDHWEKEELFDVTLRLLVNLTNPALLLYREEVPVERTARHNYLQILTHLQSYKEEAFTKVETWQVFAKKLAKILEIDWSERDEDTGLIIERILILIRNVLHVPADLDKERRPENDASVHDQVLWALNQAGILDIILYMSSENEKQYFMHIIEIISHLLREQNPTSLADAALQRSVDEKLRDDQELLTMRMAETKERMNKVKMYSSTRHSRFGGTYVIQNMKSISENELISLKPLNKISNLDFNGSKKSKLVKPKNRRPTESGMLERRSAFAIRLFLKEFCIEFLNSSYNPMMHYVKDVLVRAKAQQNDESYYLWAMKFFMEFNRGHDFQIGLVSIGTRNKHKFLLLILDCIESVTLVGQCIRFYNRIPESVQNASVAKLKKLLRNACVLKKFELEFDTPPTPKAVQNELATAQTTIPSETLSVPTFHFVQQQMEKYSDMIKVERKRFPVWVRRLHVALRAFRELLQSLRVARGAAAAVRDAARALQAALLYAPEYREFVLALLLAYDENKMPSSYLADLVETEHLFLKLLEEFCKNTGLVVQKKVRKKGKSKKQKPRAPKPKRVETAQWEEVRPQVAAVLRAGVEEYPPPFDAASDTPIDQQKEDCMKKIQKLMRDHKYEGAVGMLRAAREVWPEEGIFGVAGVTEDEELDMLETIYNTDLGVEVDASINEEEVQENSQYEDDDEEEEDTTSVVETDFDFQDFVLRFCHPRVVSACAGVLAREAGGARAAHCALKLLHRVAWDCARPAMLFQASLFLVFQRILDRPAPHREELEKFAIFILRKFTEIASKSNKVFIELLFWKNSKDSVEIEHGYDLYHDQRDKPGRAAWTEEQEEELRSLYMENVARPESDQDVIDWILDNLIDQTRTRRSVIKKLKELGLIFKAPTKKSNRERQEKVSKEFSEEEDNLLAELWKQYQDSPDPMGLITARMPRKRSKRSFVERMLELGIIQDKNQCRKRRQRKTKSSGDDGDKLNDSSSESEHSSSDDENEARPPLRTINVKRKKPSKKKESSKTKKAERLELSASEIAKLLIQAVESGLSEALKWLAENLEEVALDQEAEGFDPESEGTPLVPISSESVEAMDNPLFVKVLKSIGIAPPSDEQETYWRIPSSIHYETIRKRREIVMKAVNKELLVDSTNDTNSTENNAGATQENNPKDESSDDEDLFDTLRKMRDVSPQKSSHPTSNISNNRKRNRSLSSDDENNRKMQKIDEDDSEEDILSFAKKTLQRDDLPDTEELPADGPADLPAHDSGSGNVSALKWDINCSPRLTPPSKRRFGARFTASPRCGSVE